MNRWVCVAIGIACGCLACSGEPIEAQRDPQVAPVDTLRDDSVGGDPTPPGAQSPLTSDPFDASADPAAAIVVAPDGLEGAPGTLQQPTSLISAIRRVAVGQRLLLRGGVYPFAKTVLIERSNNGEKDRPKIFEPYNHEKPILDFSAEPYGDPSKVANPRGLEIHGSYWRVSGLEIKGAADSGVFVGGSHNVIEGCDIHHNRDSGLQIGRYSSTATQAEWPAYNLVRNCDSHDNADPDNGEDADGFACKLTTGEGNVFRGCVAHHNVDDGWDLYTKSATGPIAPVTIEGCVAYSNGSTSEGTSTSASDGNGFKLGGEKIPVAHVVKSSIAFDNKKHGFTYNSNPGAIEMTSNTSWRNKGGDFAFDNGTARLSNNLSFQGGQSDKLSGAASVGTNCWWRDGQSVCERGLVAANDDFVSLDASVARRSDGTLDLGSFLLLAPGSDLRGAGDPAGTNLGAR